MLSGLYVRQLLGCVTFCTNHSSSRRRDLFEACILWKNKAHRLLLSLSLPLVMTASLSPLALKEYAGLQHTNNALKPESTMVALTAKQAIALIGGLLTVVSFARVSVLFLEALSAVRDERNQDSELLELCQQGSARGSMKMRSACLHAQADRASPIVLKAVLRAVSIAFADFSESVSSPGKMLVVVLFVLSSLFLPMNAWLRALLPADDQGEGRPHVVVLATDPAAVLGRRRIGFKQRISCALRRNGHADRGDMLTVPEYYGAGDIEGDTFVDIDMDQSKHGNTHAKWE